MSNKLREKFLSIESKNQLVELPSMEPQGFHAETPAAPAREAETENFSITASPKKKFLTGLFGLFKKAAMVDEDVSAQAPELKVSLKSAITEQSNIVYGTYLNELNSLFKGQKLIVEVDQSTYSPAAMIPSLTYSLEVFVVIQQNIKLYKFDSSIQSLYISTSVDGHLISHLFEVELKEKHAAGWVPMYSKGLLKSITQKISEKKDFQAEGFFQNNLSTGKKTYTILFTHSYIEVRNHETSGKIPSAIRPIPTKQVEV